MIKIKEMNVSESGSIQERIIEVESWDYILNQFNNKERDGKIYKDMVTGSMVGSILPKTFDIRNLTYNDRELTCNVVIFDGSITRKFISII